LKKSVWMLSSLERGSMLVSSFIHVLTLSNINLSILVVSYFVYSTWRTSHYFNTSIFFQPLVNLSKNNSSLFFFRKPSGFNSFNNCMCKSFTQTMV
jgi:hypothetical protein